MSEDHAKLGYEKRDINVLKILLVSVVPAIMVVVSLVVLNYWFEAEQVKQEILVSKADTTELELIQSQEANVLFKYKKIDQNKYQIPVSRAIELMIDENRGAAK